MTVLFCGEYQKRIDFVWQDDEKRAPFTPFVAIMGDKWDPLFEGMSVVQKERNGCFLELWSSGDVFIPRLSQVCSAGRSQFNAPAAPEYGDKSPVRQIL